MSKNDQISWQEWSAQAERFIVFAQLATKHAVEEKSKYAENSTEYKNYSMFELVSVAVHHGFAMEALIKGIRAKNGKSFIPGHNLKKLLYAEGSEQIVSFLTERFKDEFRGIDRDRGFDFLIKKSDALFKDGRYFFDPEVQFDGYVNADFTSFMSNQLRNLLNTS